MANNKRIDILYEQQLDNKKSYRKKFSLSPQFLPNQKSRIYYTAVLLWLFFSRNNPLAIVQLCYAHIFRWISGSYGERILRTKYATSMLTLL